jgi:dynein intermediate chain 1
MQILFKLNSILLQRQVRVTFILHKIFLSCLADWTIRILDMNITRPIMTFDMNTAVGVITWSPYSSTVFAAVTSNGTLYV